MKKTKRKIKESRFWAAFRVIILLAAIANVGNFYMGLAIDYFNLKTVLKLNKRANHFDFEKSSPFDEGNYFIYNKEINK